MNRTLLPLGLAVTALLASPTPTAELKLLAPANYSLARGTVEFKVKPERKPEERFVNGPVVSVQDETGQEVDQFRPVPDSATGVCAARYDTTKLKDGLYYAVVSYRTVYGNKLDEASEEWTLGVRNGRTQPARFTVEVENKPFGPEDTCEVLVKVVDARRKPMAAARVSFKVDKGEVDAPAGITDSDGEASVIVDSDEAQTVTLEIGVENLPPVKKALRFID